MEMEMEMEMEVVEVEMEIGDGPEDPSQRLKSNHLLRLTARLSVAVINSLVDYRSWTGATVDGVRFQASSVPPSH
jgi:hypothetical protein